MPTQEITCHGCGGPTAVAVPTNQGTEPTCWRCLHRYWHPHTEIVVTFHHMPCDSCGAPTAPPATTVAEGEHVFAHPAVDEEHATNGR